MQTLDYVSGLDNFREFSQSFECLDQVMETRKGLLSSDFIKYLSRVKQRAWRDNLFCSHANTRIDQWEQAGLLSELFYK